MSLATDKYLRVRNAANLLACCLDTAVFAVTRPTTRTYQHEPLGLAADVQGEGMEGKIL